jgi:hypothetical protein
LLLDTRLRVRQWGGRRTRRPRAASAPRSDSRSGWGGPSPWVASGGTGRRTAAPVRPRHGAGASAAARVPGAGGRGHGGDGGGSPPPGVPPLSADPPPPLPFSPSVSRLVLCSPLLHLHPHGLALRGCALHRSAPFSLELPLFLPIFNKTDVDHLWCAAHIGHKHGDQCLINRLDRSYERVTCKKPCWISKLAPRWVCGHHANRPWNPGVL